MTTVCEQSTMLSSSWPAATCSPGAVRSSQPLPSAGDVIEAVGGEDRFDHATELADEVTKRVYVDA